MFFWAHLGTGAEGLLCSLLVGRQALPGSEGRGLKGAAVGEGQLPGPVQGHLVDGVEVDRGLFLTLAS